MIPSALASVAAKVNTSSAKAYKSASTKSAHVSVPKNTKVTITAFSGSWAKVTSGGVTAYMPVKYLSPTNKVKGYATGSTTVYNSSGKKMSTISKGTCVNVLGTVDGYYCVSNSSGAVGFVKTGTLSENKPAAVTEVKVNSGGSSKADKALQVAQTLLGRPYKSGSNPPSSFDCSSFVKYCMEKAGYSMKKTAATQAADSRYAKITSVSDLKKGDVLFFDTTGDGNVDHSAIYVGSGTFVEASRNAGKVQTNTMTNWYKSHFKWARRPG